MKIKNENYLTIQGWMYNLGLSSTTEIMAYALVYGFSQDENSQFSGSIAYIQSWLQCSKSTAINTMKKLQDKGLIIKHQEQRNGVVFNNYIAVLPQIRQGVQNLDRGDVQNLDPIYNNDTYKENINFVNAKESELSFDTQENTPKISLEEKIEACKRREDEFYNEVMKFVNEYSQDMLKSFFDYWSEPNKSKTKMRFENERTFELKRRLVTWANNEKKFSRNGNGYKTKIQREFETIATTANLVDNVLQQHFRTQQ